MFLRSSGSLSLMYWRRPTSTWPCFFSFYLFLTILIATSTFSLWSKQSNTTPKDPLPNYLLISYLNPIWSCALHRYSPFSLSYPPLSAPCGGSVLAFLSNRFKKYTLSYSSISSCSDGYRYGASRILASCQARGKLIFRFPASWEEGGETAISSGFWMLRSEMMAGTSCSILNWLLWRILSLARSSKETGTST